MVADCSPSLAVCAAIAARCLTAPPAAAASATALARRNLGFRAALVASSSSTGLTRDSEQFRSAPRISRPPYGRLSAANRLLGSRLLVATPGGIWRGEEARCSA